MQSDSTPRDVRVGAAKSERGVFPCWPYPCRKRRYSNILRRKGATLLHHCWLVLAASLHNDAKLQSRRADAAKKRNQISQNRDFILFRMSVQSGRGCGRAGGGRVRGGKKNTQN